MPQTREQWEAHMIEKYGSVEAGKAEMQRRRALAKNPGTGGFHHMKEHDPERFQEIVKKATKARWNTKT